MKSHCVHNTLHRQFCSSLNVTSFLKSFPCNPEQWRNCNICKISVDYCILSRCLSNLSCVYCFTWNILYSVFYLNDLHCLTACFFHHFLSFIIDIIVSRETMSYWFIAYHSPVIWIPFSLSFIEFQKNVSRETLRDIRTDKQLSISFNWIRQDTA